MRTSQQIAGLTLLIVVLAGCARPVPPPPEILARGMAEALMDTGLYADVAVGRVIGQHHNPGENRWTVYACFDFSLDDGSLGSSCIDSVSARQLENGSWIIAVTINDIYRWRAISLLPDNAGSAGTEAPPQR